MSEPDPKQIPYLLKLLEDDDEYVREEVLKALAAFGPSLEKELDKLEGETSESQKEMIKQVFAMQSQFWMTQAWHDWCKEPESKEKLETGLSLIVDFQSKKKNSGALTKLLDQLAEEFRAVHGYGDVLELAEFLFQGKGLHGNQNDYYSPFNSNLVYVIQEKKGIPISLACIYILVGHRLNLRIGGCNLPGHFLARTFVNGEIVLVDCFQKGRLLNEKMLVSLNPGSARAIREIIRTEADSKTIMRRVLSNLSYSYEQAENVEQGQFIADLLKYLESNFG